MKRRVLLLLPVFAVFLCPLCAQDPSQNDQRPSSGRAQRGNRGRAQDPSQNDQRLPSGKSQKEEILKADHQKSLRDAAELVRLAEELKADFEKSDYHILSLGAVKKTEEIEKLARRIKSRLRRF
jgi:hypothetical protein